MRHPFTRAERRSAWSLARTRYRNKLQLMAQCAGTQPEQNQYWNRGGKQCEAHGNRCAHSLIARHDRRTEIKASRKSAPGASIGANTHQEVSSSNRLPDLILNVDETDEILFKKMGSDDLSCFHNKLLSRAAAR